MKRKHLIIKVTSRTQSTIYTKERQQTITMCGLPTIKQHYNQGLTPFIMD